MWRYVQDEGRNLHKIVDAPGWMLNLFRRSAYKYMKTTTWAQGIGRLRREDVFQIMSDDLRTLSIILGSKKYILGDEVSEVDCTVFGMLANCLWSMPGSPYEKLVQGNDKITLLY